MFSPGEREALLNGFAPVIQALKKTNPNVRFFEQNEIFCAAERCSYVRNGMPLHRDELHISEYASIELHSYFNEWAKENVPELFDPGYVDRP